LATGWEDHWTIVLWERNQEIARIDPERPERQRPVKYPDFAA
jgi:hypothetical protein